MSLWFRFQSTFPLWLTLCLLLSLGSVGILATAPALAQGRKQNSEQKVVQREDGDRQLRIGTQAQQSGQLDKAIFHWLKATVIYQRFGDEEGLGQAYDYLGEAYTGIGDFVAAENAFRRRLAVARDLDDLQAQMFALNNLGTLFIKQGNLNLAEEVFTDALAIARSVENSLAGGISLTNLGLTASLRGDFDEAIKRYQTALIFRRQAKDPAGEALTLTNLGDAYFNNGQAADSLTAYSQGYSVARDINDFRTQFRAFEGRFKVYRATEQFIRATRELNRWVSLAQDQDNPVEQFQAIEKAAYFYAALGDKEQASVFLTEAIAQGTDIGALDNVAFLQQKLSEIQYGG